ncbi:MAG: UvrD-helicase domain-containing protein, partial [Acidobacteriota bacterium]
MNQLNLFDTPDTTPVDAPASSRVELPADQAARDFAVDPANHVVLEASAGTGKTRVLVERYARLIQADVDPRHILAITFTRKAAAEMRQRVLTELRGRVASGAISAKRWAVLRERIADIQISTIDAFCFGLLREFPLEADVDPAFEIADDTEMARFTNEALDLTLRAARALVTSDETVRLLFARVKLPVLREAVGSLLDRRQIALPAVASFVARHSRGETAEDVGARFISRIDDVFTLSLYRSAILDDGPAAAPEFRVLAASIASLDRFPVAAPGRVHQLRRQLERYFLTKDGKPRQRLGKPFKDAFASRDAKKRHEQALPIVAAALLEEHARFDHDISVLLARGLLRVLTIAIDKYETLLNEHSLLDFAGMLDRAVALLERQEDFARSRLKLQSRYHHVLVDELQDTSRRQWRLIELLIDAWGEGEGVADAPMSVFVVGDRKQSIYRFRHAEVTILDEAARKIAGLRPARVVTQAISTSFRAVPELLAFVNALSLSTVSQNLLEDRFRYEDTDRFPVVAAGVGARRDGEPVLGIVAEESMAACATAVAGEIQRLLGGCSVRETSGSPRAARPDDIAILFRARAGHQYFERALEARGIPTYVYKGLGFFDAPEVQDLQALIRYLAQPESDLRAAELLRSRIVRISDPGLVMLAPAFAAALTSDGGAETRARLNVIDRALLEQARAGVSRWLSLADRLRPSELLDRVLHDSAYAAETGGRRFPQARENIKKVRNLVRRVENRGYATLDRLAAYFDALRAGDESNALVEAAGSVNLMTIHAAKGLEFPM